MLVTAVCWVVEMGKFMVLLVGEGQVQSHVVSADSLKLEGVEFVKLDSLLK